MLRSEIPQDEIKNLRSGTLCHELGGGVSDYHSTVSSQSNLFPSQISEHNKVGGPHHDFVVIDRSVLHSLEINGHRFLRDSFDREVIRTKLEEKLSLITRGNCQFSRPTQRREQRINSRAGLLDLYVNTNHSPGKTPGLVSSRPWRPPKAERFRRRAAVNTTLPQPAV